MCTLLQKNAIWCLFLKNVSPSKTVLCFIMGECIAFYALYKSRVLIIACKTDDSCLFIGLPDEIYKNLIFSLFCGLTLSKHYIIKATWLVIYKNLHSVLKQC